MRSKQSSSCFETTPNATQCQTLDLGSQRNHNIKESQTNFLDIDFQAYIFLFQPSLQRKEITWFQLQLEAANDNVFFHEKARTKSKI